MHTSSRCISDLALISPKSTSSLNTWGGTEGEATEPPGHPVHHTAHSPQPTAAIPHHAQHNTRGISTSCHMVQNTAPQPRPKLCATHSTTTVPCAPTHPTAHTLSFAQHNPTAHNTFLPAAASQIAGYSDSAPTGDSGFRPCGSARLPTDNKHIPYGPGAKQLAAGSCPTNLLWTRGSMGPKYSCSRLYSDPHPPGVFTTGLSTPRVLGIRQRLLIATRFLHRQTGVRQSLWGGGGRGFAGYGPSHALCLPATSCARVWKASCAAVRSPSEMLRNAPFYVCRVPGINWPQQWRHSGIWRLRWSVSMEQSAAIHQK